jgi:DNA-binding phage protein
MDSKKWKEVKIEDFIHKITSKSPAAANAYKMHKAIYDAARALSNARKAQGMTQQQLAKKMGTTQTQVHRLLNSDEQSNPTIGSLARAANALDLELIVSFKSLRAPKGKARPHR